MNMHFLHTNKTTPILSRFFLKPSKFFIRFFLPASGHRTRNATAITHPSSMQTLQLRWIPLQTPQTLQFYQGLYKRLSQKILPPAGSSLSQFMTYNHLRNIKTSSIDTKKDSNLIFQEQNEKNLHILNFFQIKNVCEIIRNLLQITIICQML